MPPTHPAHAIPQAAYPTPPRFIGAVLRFLVIAALDRVARRVIARLGRKPAPATPRADRPVPASGRRHREAHR